MPVKNFSQNSKGVYVISLVSRGYGKLGKSLKLPDDSIFVSHRFAVQKMLGIYLSDFNGKTDMQELLETYYLIDFKKDRFKDIGKDLEKQTNKIPWEPLGKKKMGFKFTAVWHKNETYKTENSFLQGKKVKKVSYLTKEGERYEVYLQPCPAKNSPPVFFRGLEDKFHGILLKMIITYPEKKGSFTYTTKFVQLRKHKVLKALEKLK
ncbi:hypothetical protein [Flavobacterium sp. S87F.05.LMB.W.Kidney.N]|uniref:hypothetical protein n=1 Tax=Flavobacterium sp. S87F.05.LMB.W.Kidney.N TaxID=1278758 RepID=UPI0010E0CB11|nr:hypothetical protein [Flavobacterium sp. S87F.05.LMB.W.Kidney.N]TDX11234.1 hypothetical protein EDB96_2013 [Flavobacterium sp. S87F.05.LMB.W.Kidney.N]